MKIVEFVGPHHALQLFGIKLVGIDAYTGKKLLFTIVFIAAILIVSKILRMLLRGWSGRSERVAFWIRQAIRVLALIVFVIGLASIWFESPERLLSAGGFVAAGVAFALQRVITSFAGYVLILRGNTFNVGDRIVMGGVRGDVIALGFFQTTIMEMGQPPPVQEAPPAMWVKARQYTGRICTVPNAKIFDEPVYNYTREFPFIWDEMTLPIAYRDNRHTVEKILLDAAEKHTVKIAELSHEALAELERRYVMKRSDMHPTVYFRMTDNWLEMTVRFIARDHDVRDLKNAMTREILDALDKAKIGIASSTYDVVGMPPIQVRLENS